MLLKNSKNFLEVKNQCSLKIKRFRSGRGQEYDSSEFNYFVPLLGIIHESIASYSRASNGVAEIKKI